MKVLAFVMATVYGAGSYLAGTEMRECGGEMCTKSNRSHGTLVCLQIDSEVRDYYGENLGEEGTEKCFCIHAYNWMVGRRNKKFKINASATHECAWKHLHSDVLVVDSEAGGPFTDETTTPDCS